MQDCVSWEKQCVQHIRVGAKWPKFCRQYFQMHFLERLFLILNKISLEYVCSWQNNNYWLMVWLNTLRLRQNCCHFADDLSNVFSWMKIYQFCLWFVTKARINNILALVQIMAWCRPGNKPLSELMMVSLLTHICVTQPQWVKANKHKAITWTNVDQDLWYHTASVGHNELISISINQFINAKQINCQYHQGLYSGPILQV